MRGLQSLLGDIPREMFDAMASTDAEAEEQHAIYKVRSAMSQNRSSDAEQELADQQAG